MPIEREARDVPAGPEFVKFSTLGISAAGKVREFGRNATGDFLRFAPALVRLSGRWYRYDAVLVGITTDMARKVDKGNDVGRLLKITYHESESMGDTLSPKKIFLVEELSIAEIREIAALAAQGEPLRQPRTAGKGEEPDLF